MKTRRRVLNLEYLEDRLVPTFNSVFSGNTLTITQTAANGPALVTVTPTGVNVTDLSGTASLGVAPANLTVNMLSNSGTSLRVNLDSPLAGDLTVNLGEGNRDNGIINFPDFTLDGTANTVNGDLRVTAGGGDQQMNAISSTVGGNMDLNLGTGFDVFNPQQGNVVGGNVTARGVNVFFDNSVGATVIGGNLSVITGENILGLLSFVDGAADTIGGNVTYQGGTSEDDVLFADGGAVGGFMNINLGNNMTAGTDQRVVLTAVSVGGNLTVTSGLNVAGTIDLVSVGVLSSLAGNVTLHLGEGNNSTSLLGVLTGPSVYYSGGSGLDAITYSPAIGSGGQRFTAYLGAGNDSVAFGPGAARLVFAFIDFGAGSDSVTGVLNFPLTFRNLP